ncbi:small-conductance mechanosensitive channel MscS [Ravibacter arvi]|uniref:Small-conductance mechanosensitive channel MscS n=1 Tax=Ravibacter arvi TaxID=2051041 RepID=A0ABP8LYA2_9BACT
MLENTGTLFSKAEYLTQKLIDFAPNLIIALLTLFIGFWVANKLGVFLKRIMVKRGMDSTVVPFLTSIVIAVIKILVVISVAGSIGVKTASFIALLGGAGLAIGLAFQGSLSHFASGIMILIFKPYKVGDLVQLKGTLGNVEEIQIFNTVIRTPDNKQVIIPNGLATSDIMTNLTANGKLRVDLNVAVPYEEDFEKIKGLIRGALDKVAARLPDEPTIEINSFGESGLILDVRPYATDVTYWDVYFDSYREIKKALGEAGIRVPYRIELAQMPAVK